MMNPINETHPYMVSIWVKGTPGSSSLFDKPAWMEMARCQSDYRARNVAQALAIIHARVQIARLNEQGDRFVEVTVLERDLGGQDDIDRSERDRRILESGGSLDDPTGPSYI